MPYSALPPQKTSFKILSRSAQPLFSPLNSFFLIINCSLKWKISIFLYLKIEFHNSYLLALFITFSVMAAMLPITTKLNVMLWGFFRHKLGKELKTMATLPLKNIFYSAITHLILNISPFSQLTKATLKFSLMETLGH